MLKVLKYELYFKKEFCQEITLDLIKGIDCERWAIKIGEFTLGKTMVEGMLVFYKDPLPSERDEEYYKEYRWDNKEDAIKFWEDNEEEIKKMYRRW